MSKNNKTRKIRYGGTKKPEENPVPTKYDYYKGLLIMMKEFVNIPDLRYSYINRENHLGMITIRKNKIVTDEDNDLSINNTETIIRAPSGSSFDISMENTKGDAHFIIGFKVPIDEKHEDGIMLFDPSYPKGIYESVHKYQLPIFKLIGIRSKHNLERKNLYMNHESQPQSCQKKYFPGDSFCQSWSLMNAKNPNMQLPRDPATAVEVADMLLKFYKDFYKNKTIRSRIKKYFWKNVEDWEKTSIEDNAYEAPHFSKTKHSMDKFFKEASSYPRDILIYILYYLYNTE